MTVPESEVGFALGPKNGGSPVKPVECWEGANGNLKRSQAEAAADIISNAGYNDAHPLLGGDDPMPEKSKRLGEAIVWAAEQIKSRSLMLPLRNRRKKKGSR